MLNHEKLKVFFRGEFVDFDKAVISISNSGFLYGLGVFTGIRGHYNEARDKLYIFRPKDHYDRFVNACKLCHYTGFLSTYTYEKFLTVLRQIVQLNNIKQDIYFRVTNFTDENRITPKFVEYKDSFSVFLYPLGDYVPTGGMRCMVSSWTRNADNSIPSRAKINGAYVNTAFAKTDALRMGFDEAIFLDRNGHVVEGSAENIFVIIDGTVITPPVTDDILEGITRKTVIDLCRDMNVPCVERSIDRTELYRADEVLLTGTGAKISPVVEIDHRAIGSGKIGPIGQRLQEQYFRAVRGEEKKFMSWLVDAYER